MRQLLPLLEESWDRALVVVAHPDDVEYSGLGAAVARWTARGKKVAYLVLTRGEAGMDRTEADEAADLRTAEQLSAARAVGVGAVEFADLPDGAVEYGVPLRCLIAATVRRHRPGALFTLSPHLESGQGGYNSADHRSASLATLDAARDAGNRWVCRHLDGKASEPWAGVRMVGCAVSPAPTHAIDVSDYVEAGVTALLQHRAYIESVSSPEETEAMLRQSLRRSGTALGVQAALPLQVFAV
ncbi:MAG: PIG-L deacetylase family protein [Acidimicrobiales bacterium]